METKFTVKKYEQLTPWFDLDQYKPVHDGSYEVRYSEDGGYVIKTFHWSNDLYKIGLRHKVAYPGWGYRVFSNRAMPISFEMHEHLLHSPHIHWRGLAHSPAKRIALRVQDGFNNFLKKIC